MSREDLREVGKHRKTFEDARVELLREFRAGLLAQEVRSADVADEEEVAGEREPGNLAAPGLVVEKPGDVLWRVAGRVDCLESQAADAKHRAVDPAFVGVGWRPFLSAERRGVNEEFSRGTGLELGRAADEVRVDVRLQHVANAETLASRDLQELADVSGRIDDDGLPGSLIRDEIGVDREAGHEALMEEHVHLESLFAVAPQAVNRRCCA